MDQPDPNTAPTPRPSTTMMHDLSCGFRGRCPNCGKGKLFQAFLKPVERCAVCGEEYYHHRADDLPAYIVILITGHLFVGLAVDVELRYHPPVWVHIALWLPLIPLTTIALLQPVKGAIIALQWRIGMHGFAAARRRREGLE